LVSLANSSGDVWFSEPRQLNLVLKGTARLALIFGLLFAAGLAIGGTTG
jgi:hypothetical protein